MAAPIKSKSDFFRGERVELEGKGRVRGKDRVGGGGGGFGKG